MAFEDLNKIPTGAGSGAHSRRQLFLEPLAYEGVACARVLSLKRQQRILILLPVRMARSGRITSLFQPRLRYYG